MTFFSCYFISFPLFGLLDWPVGLFISVVAGGRGRDLLLSFPSCHVPLGKWGRDFLFFLPQEGPPPLDRSSRHPLAFTLSPCHKVSRPRVCPIFSFFLAYFPSAWLSFFYHFFCLLRQAPPCTSPNLAHWPMFFLFPFLGCPVVVAGFGGFCFGTARFSLFPFFPSPFGDSFPFYLTWFPNPFSGNPPPP